MGRDGYLHLRIICLRFFHYSHFLKDEKFKVCEHHFKPFQWTLPPRDVYRGKNSLKNGRKECWSGP